MVAPATQAVVLVRFPFSDLFASKLRPAVVQADAGRGDWVLCQITGNPYADAVAVRLDEGDFTGGSLHRTSFVRPGKLFTANSGLIATEVGRLKPDKYWQVVAAIVGLLQRGA